MPPKQKSFAVDPEKNKEILLRHRARIAVVAEERAALEAKIDAKMASLKVAAKGGK